MKYQGATAWVDPTADMLPGANLQWFTTQGGVWGKGISSNVGWTSVDAPLITLGDINRGLWPESVRIDTASVFSYVMNNYWYTDTPAQQGGRFTFRYALTSGPEVSEAQTMALASGQRSQLFAIRHYNMGWLPMLPDAGASFLQTSPAGISVLTIRPLEHGNYLVRAQNTTGEAMKATLKFSRIKLHDAHLGSVMGEKTGIVDWTSDSVTMDMGRYEIKSLVVRPKAGEAN